jgi:hypothetical protein
MSKTKTKKVLAILAIVTMAFTNLGSAIAAQIGTWSVTGNPGLDQPIIWDDTFPWFATGTVDGIVVTADITPTLTMIISTGAISLGTLTSSAYSTGFLDIEIWTNAVDWVTVYASSWSGWLTNTSDNNIQINNAVVDWAADSYKFVSSLNAASDSTTTWYTQTANLNVEVNDSTVHTIYTTTKPEQNSGVNDVRFFVSAQPNAQTAAWNYQDNVTFTVVGNF